MSYPIALLKESLYPIAKPHLKSIAAMTAVMLITASVCGKIFFLGFALFGFALYQGFGPALKIVNYVDLKGISLIILVVVNGYLRFIPPIWLTWYLAACLLAREWSVSRIEAYLKRHAQTLKSSNQEWERSVKNLDESTGQLETGLRSLLATTKETEVAKDNLLQAKSEHENIQQQIQKANDKLFRVMRLITDLEEDEETKACIQVSVQLAEKNEKLQEELFTSQQLLAKITLQLQETANTLKVCHDLEKSKEVAVNRLNQLVNECSQKGVLYEHHR